MTTMLYCKALDLTKAEQDCVRAALHFLKIRLGSWRVLAEALHIDPRKLSDLATPKGRTISPTLAFRVARFAKVPMESLLTGTFPAPGTCPYCGHVPDPEPET